MQPPHVTRAGQAPALRRNNRPGLALYDAFPESLLPAILLGAFAGLRVADVSALRISDVDFMRGVVTPAIQYPAEPLKSECSKAPVPIPTELTLLLAAAVQAVGGSTIVTDPIGRPTSPWAIERAMRAHRGTVNGLPDGFRFHDLRHYFASLLIAAGLDVKVVQTRLPARLGGHDPEHVRAHVPGQGRNRPGCGRCCDHCPDGFCDKLRTQGGGTGR